MSISFSTSNVNSLNQVQIQENNIHQNHIFYDLVGGKDAYERLPTLDLSTHTEKLQYTDEYPITRCINGEEANTQYLLVQFLANGYLPSIKKSFPGTSLLSAKNHETDNFIDDDHDLNGSPNLKQKLQQINENRIHQRPLKNLYRELLTEGSVGGVVTDYKGTHELRIELTKPKI